MNLRDGLVSAGVAALYVLASILTVESLKPGRYWLMGLVSILSVGAFFAFRQVCKVFGLAVASGVVDSLLTILNIAIAVFFFKEPLTVKQYTGLTMLVAGMFLVR